MDSATLAQAMGNASGVNYSALVGPCNEAMIQAGCTNARRAAMWCAQIGHESVGLKYMEEIASGAAYEWRQDLGNTQAGDGVRFKGRGPIQLTGRNNYGAFSRWCHARGLVGSPTYFVDNPRLVSEYKWGFLAAAYYWSSSRPNLNKWSDEGNVLNASREINGWVTTPNGLADRQARYNRCISMGDRLLPTGGGKVSEKVLEYPRDQVLQDTFYNCGPASAQTIIRSATRNLIGEKQLGSELRTTTNGTDWIGQFPSVLNKHIPGAQYKVVEMPNDPPTQGQRDRLWNDIVSSIDAGHGVVANIVAPPSNYPRHVPPSTMSPAYGGGTVYHYVAVMGYSDGGGRRYWVADSGFPGPNGVTGYWISHHQLSTLIPPKGYAYSTAPSKKGLFMALTDEEQRELLVMTRRIHHELTFPFQSRYVDPETGESSSFKETLVGYALEADKKMESLNAVQLPAVLKTLDNLAEALKKNGKN